MWDRPSGLWQVRDIQCCNLVFQTNCTVDYEWGLLLSCPVWVYCYHTLGGGYCDHVLCGFIVIMSSVGLLLSYSAWGLLLTCPGWVLLLSCPGWVYCYHVL